MKSKIYITGAAGFIGFHTAKKFLDKGIKVHGFDPINDYYDVNLKRSRLNNLKRYKNFSFTKGLLEKHKLLNQSVLKFKPKIIIHLAQQGQTLYSIAKLYDLSLPELYSMNHHLKTDSININQHLVVGLID